MPQIPTPQSSTLSLLSDTEIDDAPTTTMPAVPRPIYLIVATALKPPMGIGLKGLLPWPPLKKDMAFFRAVTSGVEEGGKRNAVIMGRKTWESIPRKFRPLKGRVNVVVTRGLGEGHGGEVVAVGGVEEGLRLLDEKEEVGSVFVIGGSQVYGAVVEKKWEGPVRVLQTLVRRGDGKEIECDTFFPIRLEERGKVEGWRRVSGEEMMGWVEGETVPGGDGEWVADGESGMEVRVVGWERVI